MTHAFQPGILAPVPPLALYLSHVVTPGLDPRPGLAALAEIADGDRTVVGLGESLVRGLGASVHGLRAFPALTGSRHAIPSTPSDLWVWVRGDDRGDLFHQARRIGAALGSAFSLVESIDCFRHGEGRDLTGYVDGTENPDGDDAVRVAIAGADAAARPAPAGSSFVAVQRWQHSFERFDAMSREAQDLAIGRRRDDDAEIDDAPPSAHVRRTAQEDFDPQAFVVRRSMPWSDGARAGLMFVAFAASFDAFEAQLRRMAGLDDGIDDALFGFTRPVSGAYFWCPPVSGGRIDLGVLGL